MPSAPSYCRRYPTAIASICRPRNLDLTGDLSLTCSDAHGRFYSAQRQLFMSSDCSAYVTLRGSACSLCSENRRSKSASASLFQPMPAPLCLPGERTPCERKEMRCKGHRVPIRATPPSPICAQFMPLLCCGLGSTDPSNKAIFQPAPLASLRSLSLRSTVLSVKRKSDTAP